MNMTLRLRKAVINDADAIVRHWKDFMAIFIGNVELDMAMVPDAQERFKRYVLKCIRSKKSLVIVAERNGNVVGYSIWNIDRRPPVYMTDKQAYVMDIYMTKSERGRGTGKKLMETMMGWAREKGLRLVALNVHPENAGAIRFYRRLGFKPVFYNLVKRL